MCGISVIIRKISDEQDCNAAIQRMVNSQAHRGPDGFGFHYLNWETEEIWLGHNLLSLTGSIKNAGQPLISTDENCGIIFNGEIYNYELLRKELVQAGIKFSGDTDTEVLLAWVRQFGRRGLKRLEGMFAFVFWDSQKKLLIIHRDGYGIKPLFYARNKNYLLFASETTALFAAGLMNFQANFSALPYFLTYKFIPGHLTAWTGIHQLQPGECIEFWESKPMHYTIPGELPSKFDGLKEAMDAAFSAVIPKNQEFGLALSGGIDSGLILSWCLDHGYKPQIFSIRFPKNTPLFADTAAVEELSKNLGLEVNWIDIPQADSIGLSSAAGDPLIADSAMVLTKLIAQAASEKGLKILISGAGADEWFGGYRRHEFFKRWLSYRSRFPGLLKFISSKIHIGKLRWMNLKSQEPEDIWQAAVSTCLRFVNKEPLRIPFSSGEFGFLEKALRWDQQHYLVQDVLFMTDYACMQHGIEGRFPFLHPAITDYASAIPAEIRLGKGRKEILTNEFARRFGTKLASRKKQGLGLPAGIINQEIFSTGNLEVYAKELTVNYPDIVAVESFKKFCDVAIKQPQNYFQEWYSIFSLLQWLKSNHKPEGAAFP